MLLSKSEILKLVKSGKIRVEPFNKKNVGPASIDLTLGDNFAIPSEGKEIELKSEGNYKNYFREIKADKLKLCPGDFVLGITQEKITLPEDIAGILEGRSRFARLGLLIHATASLIHPGISNKQVFEIKNIGKNILVLKKGLRLGQLSFLEVKGKAKYNGLFKKQERVK
jgi:dCTP deaminase